MRNLAFLTFAFIALAVPAQAQMERTVYQIFPSDSVKTISLDLVGQYELIPWAGDNVLAETHIKIWNASPDILEYLIEKGRYELQEGRDEVQLQLSAKDKKRKTLKNRDGIWCEEQVSLKLFVPDFYAWPRSDSIPVTELTIKEK
jgi:hypothetical protein